MCNIIYYIEKNGLTNWNNILGCKIGSTCNIIQRLKTYMTGFVCFPNVTYYIVNTDCYQIDENIKKDFNHIRLKSLGSRGGSEFYDSSILTLLVLEEYFIEHDIKFEKKSLLNEEENEILSNPFLTDKEELDKKNDICNQKLTKRDRIQDNYVDESINELNINKRVLAKAPTGFGKTRIIYKLIAKMNLQNVLILTPRLLLNKQILEDKYTKYINNYQPQSGDCVLRTHEIKELDGSIENKENIIKNLSNKFILSSCYQSYETVSQLIIKYNLKVNIIFDEAHCISSWTNIDNLYLQDNELVENRLFVTATPTDNMIIDDHIFGKLIEKVKVYELIKDGTLCNIVTIVKKLDNQKNEYHDLSKMIIESIHEYNKIKSIVYVNNCYNAENLFKLLFDNKDINVYIYISKK